MSDESGTARVEHDEDAIRRIVDVTHDSSERSAGAVARIYHEHMMARSVPLIEDHDDDTTLTIEKRSYSANPWRLVTGPGKLDQVLVTEVVEIDGRALPIQQAISGATKSECVAAALHWLVIVARNNQRLRAGPWTPADQPPDADQPDTGDGPSSRLCAVEINPDESPEPDALVIVVRGRWWPGTDEHPTGAWRNREGQELPATRWRELAEDER